MPLLGPRVGGAHVEVNMDFDDKELDRIGAKIHRQLERLGGEADQTFGRQFRESIGEMQVMIGSIVTALPLITSAISALGGSLVALSAGIANAAKSSLALVGIVGALAIAAGTAMIGFEGFGDALSAETPEELAKALENLSPAARAAALAVRSLKDDWKRLRLNIQERMFAGLSDSISNLSDTILPVLSEGLGKMADALNKLFGSVLDYVNSSDGLEIINSILDRSAGIFSTLADTAVPFLDGLLRIWDALLPSSGRLAERIAGVAESFSEWANGEGMAERIDAMMVSAEESASKLWDVIKNLGGAIRDIFGAALPAGNNFLDWLVEITGTFRDWVSSAEGQSSIATWAQDGVDAFQKLGDVLGSAGSFFAKISDPQVIQGALDILKEMFDTLNQLPLESIAEGIGNLFSENSGLIGGILAAGTALSGLRVIGGTLNAVFGGVATTILNFTGIFTFFKDLLGDGGVLGPIAAQGARGVGVGRVTQVLGSLGAGLRNIGAILPKLLKGAGIAGLVLWIGTTIAGSEELRKKLGDIFKKLGEVFGKLGEAIGKVAKSLEPVFKAFMAVMDFLTPILEFLISVSFDVLLEQLDALGTIISGVGDLLSGFIDVIVGLFTLDFDKVKEGFGKMFSGIGDLVAGAIQSVTAFPRIIGEAAFNAIKNFGSAIVSAAPSILTFIGNLVLRITMFVATLPGKFLELAASAMVSLGGAVVNAIPGIISSVSGFIGRVIGFIGTLPGRFGEFARTAMSDLLTGITNGVGAVIDVISGLPGTIMEFLSGLPGQMLDLGLEIVSSLASGILDGIGGALTDALGSIGDTIGSFIPGSPVREGPLTAWNYGSGASGGGRNIIAALAEGLRDVSPISAAMRNMAAAVAAPVGVANRSLSVVVNNPAPEPASDSLSRTARSLSYLGMP